MANDRRQMPSERYPYSFSPLEFLAEQERKIFAHESNEEALCTALNLANSVANYTADFTRSRLQNLLNMRHWPYDAPFVSADNALAGAGNAPHLLQIYVEDIGREIHRAGYRYQPEGLLSSAFAADQIGSPFHLDCDLLTYMTLHAAYRHNLPLAAVPAPNHMYIGSFRYPNFAMEMTRIGHRPLATTHQEQEGISKNAGVSSQDAHDYHPCQEKYLKAEIIRCLKLAAVEQSRFV